MKDLLTLIIWYDSCNKQTWISYMKNSKSYRLYSHKLLCKYLFFSKLLFSKQIFLTISLFIFLFPSYEIPNVHGTTCLYKRNINAKSIERIKHSWFEINWNEIESNLNSIKASQLFLSKATPVCEASFPIRKVWTRDLWSPCIIDGLWISLGCKSRLPNLSHTYFKNLLRTKTKNDTVYSKP